MDGLNQTGLEQKNPIPADGPGEGSTPADIASKGISLFIAIFALGIAVAGFRFYDKNHLPDAFFLRKISRGAEFDMVFVGDSRVYRGIAASTTGKSAFPSEEVKAFNYGFSSLGITPDVLKDAASKLSPTGKKILVIGVSRPNLAPAAQKENGYLDLQKLNAWERTNALMFAGVEARFRLKKGSNYISKPQADGWVWSKKTPEKQDEFTKESAKLPETERVSPEVLDRLEKSIAEFSQQGIKVFAVRLPTTQGMFEVERDRLGWDEQMVRAKVEAGGGTWISAPPYAEEFHCYDGSHLRHDGAEAFSKWLGERMRESGL